MKCRIFFYKYIIHFLLNVAAVKPAVHLLQIQEVHLGPHSNACNFCLLYFFILVLSRSCFASRTPETKRETSMSSAVNTFVHAICKRSKKSLTQKVVRFCLLGLIPMIQLTLDSTWVLQYVTGCNFLSDVHFSNLVSGTYVRHTAHTRYEAISGRGY